MPAKTKTKSYEVTVTFQLHEEIVFFADDQTVKEKGQEKMEELITIYDCNDYDVFVKVLECQDCGEGLLHYTAEVEISAGDIITVDSSSKKGAIAIAKEEFKEKIEFDPEHGFDIDLCLSASAEIQEG